MLYDVFICHATEDKQTFVRPLAELLRQNRLEVWYDEFSLRPGDSLRRSIDRGLSKSRFGVVVLSRAFFAKGWAQWELDGLVHRQVSGGATVIIPLWHGIGREDVEDYSHSLADKVAITSSLPLDEVVLKVLAVVRPEGSTLLIARDILIDHGLEPPVVTDDWWLDIIESFAEQRWNRWHLTLPIGADDLSPESRGRRLAWLAMEQIWQWGADHISQISHPFEVLSYIESQAGMLEACMADPMRVLDWAPQMAIPGFGGPFESTFERILMESTGGCTEELALRHPTFGDYEPDELACTFVQGSGGGLGPSSIAYDIIDYAVWFLSSKSDWLPRRHHEFLLSGMKDRLLGYGVVEAIPVTSRK